MDLTDPAIVRKMNIDMTRFTQVVVDANIIQKNAVYQYTNSIANQAYDQGYSGVIYPSSRNLGTTNNRAVILFDGRYDSSKITPIINVPIRKK
ncbi:hypothetical protein [Undibacterium danionis]|uniref:RES domain-containing protein n=1 Tax=Undibacterium danionis TaxID=1812100 RepID=A0ABV6IGD5_9BURK